MLKMKRHIGNYAMFMLVASVAFTTAGASTPAVDNLPPAMQAQLAKMNPDEQQMLMNYTPELRQKFFALSPEVRATLKQAHSSHTRHSKTLTLR